MQRLWTGLSGWKGHHSELRTVHRRQCNGDYVYTAEQMSFGVYLPGSDPVITWISGALGQCCDFILASVLGFPLCVKQDAGGAVDYMTS